MAHFALRLSCIILMPGSKGLSPTYEQAHVGLDLLTLASFKYLLYAVIMKEYSLFRKSFNLFF